VSETRAAWVALALTPGIGFQRLARVVAAIGSSDGAFGAPSAFLCAGARIPASVAEAIAAGSPAPGARVIERVEALGGRVLLPWDEEYPARFRDIAVPPMFLCASGRIELAAREAVAVVGSRDHTAYGSRACRTLAGAAAAEGLVVVSGMARGLDSIAHQAALDAGGATIGVLGNGIGVVYPAANRRLYQRVARDGLLLSEFPPDEPPRPGSFPRRNRLVSGLARVTLVVEAGIKSGALITAEQALEQGAEVLAVPGPITSPVSAGANRLIRDGAGPCLEPADLLAPFPALARRVAALRSASPDLGGSVGPEDPVLRELRAGPLPPDLLGQRLGRPAAGVLAALTALELAGRVSRRPDGNFEATAPAQRT
jgi:DNA processing protein